MSVQGPYVAFISYRQADSDRTVAAKLHQLLETYVTPRALVRDGVRHRPGRIFLDREEMQGGPLHAALKDALAEAHYLIVLCSPRARDSGWIADEILVFLETHSLDQILPVLLEGTPETAYPAPLFERSRREIPGAAGAPNTVYYEPLAVDLRSDSPRQALRKLRAEKLRLLAPILGTTFATLRQREKERARKRTWTRIAASGVLLILLAAAIILTNTRRVWHPTSLPTPIGGPGLAFAYKLAGDRMIWSRESGFAIYNIRTLEIERLVRGGKYAYPSPGARYLFVQPSYIPGRPFQPGVRAVEWKSGASFRLDVPNESGVIDAWSGGNEDYVSWIEESGNELRIRIRSVRENRDVASLAGLVDAPYVRNYRYFAMAEAPQQAILYPGIVTRNADRYLITGARNRRFVPLLWNLKTGQLQQILLVDRASPGAVWAYNRERDTIAVMEGWSPTQLRLSLWRPGDGALLRQRILPAIPTGDATTMLSFTKNGKTLLAPGPNGVHVLDAETLEGPFLVAARPAAAPENRDFAIELWLHPHSSGAVLENVALRKRYVLPSLRIDANLFVIVNQAGTRMVAFRRDAAPELWNLGTGERKTLPIVPTGPISFSFDERWITATRDGVAYLFRADTGEAAGTLANVERAAPPLVTDPRCGALITWFDNGRIVRYESAYRIFERVTIPATRTQCDSPRPPRKAVVTTLSW